MKAAPGVRKCVGLYVKPFSRMLSWRIALACYIKDRIEVRDLVCGFDDFTRVDYDLALGHCRKMFGSFEFMGTGGWKFLTST